MNIDFKNWKNPIKNWKRKYEKIKKDEQPKVDQFDFFMLKYGSYIRIGENRTYIKYCKDGSFRFLVLYDPEICLCFPILMLKEGYITEENALKQINSIEFSGELIILPKEKINEFTNSCIYAMAGQFTNDYHKNTLNGEDRIKQYYNLIYKPNNENFQCDALTIK